MRQEANPPAADISVFVPQFLEDIIAEFSHQVRRSGHVNQRSGVSVRLSIANLETLIASAVRRAVRTGEEEAVPRVSDLEALIQSSLGRVEFEGFEEGREAEILRRLLSQSVLEVFREYLMGFEFGEMLAAFDGGLEVDIGDLTPSASVLAQVDGLDLSNLLLRLALRAEAPADAASALEFAMEGLHLTHRLNKTGDRYAV
jgi:magnesium chelatase subunit I